MSACTSERCAWPVDHILRERGTRPSTSWSGLGRRQVYPQTLIDRAVRYRLITVTVSTPRSCGAEPLLTFAALLPAAPLTARTSKV